MKFSTRVLNVITPLSGNSKATVSTDTGEELGFDEVVMTTPLGWLKQNKSAFSPPLPARFSQAVDAIGYVCLEKVRPHLTDSARIVMKKDTKLKSDA